MQQVIPEWKRSGRDVLYSLWFDQIYAENSTPRSGHVLQRAEIIPKLIQRLQESPEDVLADFESIRKHGVFNCLYFRFGLSDSFSPRSVRN